MICRHLPAPALGVIASAPRLSPSAAPHAASADPSRGLASRVTLLQNGVVWVCAERAAVSLRPVRLRPGQLPGAGGRVFPEPARLSSGPRSPRWAAASLRRRRFCLRRCFRFLPVWMCTGAASMFADFYCEFSLNRFPRVCIKLIPRWISRRLPVSWAKASLASSAASAAAACFTFSSSHTITRDAFCHLNWHQVYSAHWKDYVRPFQSPLVETDDGHTSDCSLESLSRSLNAAVLCVTPIFGFKQ